MSITINFPFGSYTKYDLIKFIYGEDSNKVDSAIPQETADQLRDPNNPGNTFWYVQDYTQNRIFGETVNLKEKFFEKLELLAI